MHHLDVVFNNELNDAPTIRCRATLEVQVAKTQEALINDWLAALGCEVAAE